METIYIYLSRSAYLDDHINHMNAMLSCMETAGELSAVIENERADLDALEIKAEASPWAIEFLEHMRDSDMLHTTRRLWPH